MKHGCLILLILTLFITSGCAQTHTPTSDTTPPTETMASDAVETTFVLQEKNNLPEITLQTKEPKELENNRIGAMWHLQDTVRCPPVNIEAWARSNWLNKTINLLGLKWVRLSIDRFEWSQVESNQAFSVPYVNRCQDAIITLLAENDVEIVYTITYWDETLHVGYDYPRYIKEEEIQSYLDYARFIVSHFKDRIDYYEILNEPILANPQQHVELDDYINLVRRVIPVIRQEHSGAKIVVGGAARLSESPSQDYLFGILQSDIMPLVDAISIHPMYGTSPQYDDIRQYYYEYPSLVREIKDVASAHGFKGEYIAEEMVWRTSLNPNQYEPWEYTETVAAKYYARGIMMNLGMDLWAGIGGEYFDQIPPVVEVVQNLSTVMAGAESASLSVEIESDSKDIKSYTFSLTNGDNLIALFTDGVAVDDDPGVGATITILGLSAQKVTGIDVLNSFEQQLIASIEDGNLVIRNLLVKDYPIILRLSDVASS